MITGGSQDSILGPLHFNIFLNDIFLFISNRQLCNYANDNTFYKWFHENRVVLNLGKCHYVVIGDADPSPKINSNNNEIPSSNEEKRLGILLDSTLNFGSHITFLCKKSQQKVSALARVNHDQTADQKLLLLNAIVKSQFSYCH